MNKKTRKHRKVFLLIVVIFITAVTLAVETYAWFVGLSTVETNSFSIAISSVDGLELSLNGQYWTSGSTPLLIKDNNHTYITETGCSNANCAYSGNKNKWPTALVPISSNGQLYSVTNSKLTFFQKSSLSANSGGYYIYSSKLSNTTNEVDGYVAFDLFIRNGRGSSYNNLFDFDNEEDIFLSADSYANTVISGNTPDYGAANSLRVGFFELGRVASSGYNQETLTGIQCDTNTTGVTRLCYFEESPNITFNSGSYDYNALQSRTWNIWEPNYASHSTGLVSYFNNSCKKRTGENTYTDACQPIDVGTSKKTYSITRTASNVNIYDGLDINEYSYTSNFAIRSLPTYKTSDATSSGSSKYSLLKLAGNSITKVRVYIWLEGQDIDNFDIISKNPSVQVKFGFTKDRFAIEDTNNNAINTRTSSFQDDSWDRIKANVQAGNTSQYKVGDMRTVRIDGTEYRLRLANKSSPSEICSNSTYSQTACGFVVEFVDALITKDMRSTATSVGGYPSSNIFIYLNGELYEKLPDDLKNSLLSTRVVSGYGPGDSADFVSDDQKLFLLSGKEVYNTSKNDTAASKTRQLDYYAEKGVTQYINMFYAKKQFNLDYGSWWFRTANSSTNNEFTCTVADSGGYSSIIANNLIVSVAPAFRIG